MSDFEKITLKYKTADLFSKAAKTTFNKGRMTLKSKKDLQEGQRIILNVKVLDLDSAVEIVSEVIQRKAAEKEGEGNTYGLRWLNFTPKKLERFLAGETVSAPAAAAPPSAPEAEPAAPEPPAPEPTPPPPPEAEPEPEPPPPPPAEAPPPEAPAGPEPGSASAEDSEPFDLMAALRDEDSSPPSPPEPAALEPEPSSPPEPAEPEPATLEPLPEPVTPPEPAQPEPGEEFDLEVELTGGPETFSPDESPLESEPAPEPEREPEPEAVPAPEPEPEPPSPSEPAMEAEPVHEPEALLEPEPEPEEAAPEPEPAELEPDEIMEPEAAEPFEVGAAEPEEGDPAAQGAPGEESEPAPVEPPAAVEEVTAQAAPGRRFSDEELVALGGFLMKFVKLVLQASRTGSEGDFSLKGIYEEFQQLMGGRDEILIYVRSMGAVREFMLSGGGIDPVNLKNALPADQFSELAVKLVDLFVDKNIAGLQFRRYLNEEALERLVLRLGEYDPFNQSPEELGGGLIGDGVFHATVVHESDRVVDAARLDFRVDMTLSRLKGELKRLGFLAEAMGEDPAAVWTLRVEDALKALPGGDLRAELLLHAELVVAGQEEVSSAELIQEIVMSTPEEMLGEAGKLLSSRYEETFKRAEAAKDEQTQQELAKIQRVLRQVTARLLVELPDLAADIMGDLYRRGVFTLEELPPELRERMMLDQYLNHYLQDPEKRLADFGAIKTARDYKNAANRYVAMSVELVRRGQVAEGDRIFRTLLEHMRTESERFDNRPALSRECLKGLSKPHHLRVLTQALGRLEKERREAVAGMIFAAGPGAAGALLDGLAKEEDRSARRLICEILTRLGEPAAPEMLARLRDPESPWYLVRNLVMIMGDLGSDAIREDLEALLGHDHPRVREETMGWAARVLGPEAEPVLARGLMDPGAGVRRRAARALLRRGEWSDETARAAAKMVAIRPAETSTDEEQAVCSGAELASRLGGRSIGGKTMEDALIEVLESEAPKGLLGRLTGSKSLRTAKMKVALLESLGEVGTAKAKKLLGAFAKDKEAEVKQAAQQALQAISERE